MLNCREPECQHASYRGRDRDQGQPLQGEPLNLRSSSYNWLILWAVFIVCRIVRPLDCFRGFFALSGTGLNSTFTLYPRTVCSFVCRCASRPSKNTNRSSAVAVCTLCIRTYLRGLLLRVPALLCRLLRTRVVECRRQALLDIANLMLIPVRRRRVGAGA